VLDVSQRNEHANKDCGPARNPAAERSSAMNKIIVASLLMVVIAEPALAQNSRQRNAPGTPAELSLRTQRPATAPVRIVTPALSEREAIMLEQQRFVGEVPGGGASSGE
ncbi:MAG: hypothetical protein ACRCVA_12430, partial [Phreatobacter sp.]